MRKTSKELTKEQLQQLLEILNKAMAKMKAKGL